MLQHIFHVLDSKQHHHSITGKKAPASTNNSPPQNNDVTLNINPQPTDLQISDVSQSNSYYCDVLQNNSDNKKIVNQKQAQSLKQSTHINGRQIALYEEEHNSANQQNPNISVNENKKFHLSFISEIFDTFEASMRATPTSSEFVYCLINLHQSNNSGNTNKLDQRSHESCQSGPTIEQLLQHIQTLQNSFVKFAYSCKVFKHLLPADQKELLRRNGLMFVMVCT